MNSRKVGQRSSTLSMATAFILMFVCMVLAPAMNLLSPAYAGGNSSGGYSSDKPGGGSSGDSSSGGSGSSDSPDGQSCGCNTPTPPAQPASGTQPSGSGASASAVAAPVASASAVAAPVASASATAAPKAISTAQASGTVTQTSPFNAAQSAANSASQAANNTANQSLTNGSANSTAGAAKSVAGAATSKSGAVTIAPAVGATTGGTVGNTTGGSAAGGTTTTAVNPVVKTTGGAASGGVSTTNSGAASTIQRVGSTTGGTAAGGTVGNTTGGTAAGGAANGAQVSGANMLKGNLNQSGSQVGTANGNTIADGAIALTVNVSQPAAATPQVVLTPSAVTDPQPVSASASSAAKAVAAGGAASSTSVAKAAGGAASAAASNGDQTQSLTLNIGNGGQGNGAQVPAVVTNNNTNTSYRNLTFTPMQVPSTPLVQVGGNVQVLDQGVCSQRRYMLETFDPSSREAVLFGAWRTAVDYKTLLGRVGPYRVGDPGPQIPPIFSNGKVVDAQDKDDDRSFIVVEVKIPDFKNPKGDPVYVKIDYIGHRVTTVAAIHTNGGGSGLTLNIAGSDSAKAGGLTGNSANGVPQIGQVVQECVYATWEGRPTPTVVPPPVILPPIVVERLIPNVAIRSICDFGDEIDAAECDPPSAGPAPVQERPLIIAKPDVTNSGSREYRVLRDPMYCNKNPDACVTIKAKPGSTKKGPVLKMNCNDPKDQHALSCVEQYGHDDLKGLPWYQKWLEANPQYKPKPAAPVQPVPRP